jgi:hypothetical protein
MRMNSIKHLPLCFGSLSAIALVLGAPNAVAQEASSWDCQNVGNPQPEPIGDREGHSIYVGSFSCRISGGDLDGGVATGSDVWEADGPKATRLSTQGVIRKPGAMVVWSGGTGTNTFTITDGKITGWAASGTGKAILATGAWAPLSGKTDKWTSKPTGAAQFAVDQKFD